MKTSLLKVQVPTLTILKHLVPPLKEMSMVFKEDNPTVTFTQDTERHKASMLTEDETKQKESHHLNHY